VYVWDVDLDLAVRGVRKHAWVKNATAYRKFPNQVVVDIQEHNPVAMVMTDQLLYVDERGEAFLNANSSDLDFPVITGVTQGVVSAHPDLPGAVIREAVDLLQSLENGRLLYREQISEVAFDSSMGWTIFVNGGARFQFGLENIPKQLHRLGRVLSNGVSLTDSVVVDLAPETVAIVKPMASYP
jgi:cell division protein FtsQ